MARQTIYPASVQPGIPKLPSLPRGWRLKPLDDVVEVVKRPAKLQDDTEYQLVTAKRNRGGIVSREQLKGRQVKTKTQFYIESDDFLISRRQIIHGACGLVPEELSGAVVSNEYSTLVCRPGLLKEYLLYLSHSIYFQQICFHSSVGVDVEKMIFRIESWLKYKIPLPPIAIQKKIVELLGSWDDAIATTEKLIAAKQKLKRALLKKLLYNSSFKLKEFGTFVRLSNKRFDPKGGQSIPCVELEHISQNTGEFLGSVDSKNQKSSKALFSVGDVLFGKLRPYLRKFALPEFNGVCSTEIWVLKVDSKLCLYRYLFYLVQTHSFIAVANKSSGSKMPRADWKLVSTQPFPLPDLITQKESVKILDEISNEIAYWNKLNRAFKRQKRGLMQKLLTGEWSVKVKEAA